MSYQYPYIEHYSPSPSTSTPQGFAQWELQDDQVSPAQQQPPSELSPTSYDPPPTIQLQERPVRQRRTQNTATPQDPKQFSPQSATPTGVRFDVDDAASRNETRSASDMPVRPQRAANRAQLRFVHHHPYRRTSNGSSGEAKPRREYDQIQPVSAYATMACPTQPPEAGAQSASPSPLATSPLQSESPRRFMIRTDMHYSTENNILTAMLELPGVKKANLNISLRICPHSRVKQLAVTGRSGPLFADEGYTLRERKYGEFNRILVVPPETTAENVSASMEDGILFLRIPGGMPIHHEESAIQIS